MLRYATSEDIDALAKLFSDSKLNDFYKRSPMVIRKDIETGISEDEYIVYENDDNNEIEGYIRFNYRKGLGNFPYLNTIIVSESVKRQGIGMGLLRRMEGDIIDKLWNTKVFLNVVSTNETAISFYEVNGYKTIGIVEDLFHKGISECVMYKPLVRKTS